MSGQSSVPKPACPFDRDEEALRQDPYGVLAELRQSTPVAWTSAHGGHWVVSGYAAAREVLERPEDFSARHGSIPPVEYPFGPEIPLHADGEEHRRQRQVVVAALRTVPLEQVRADAHRLAADLLAPDRTRCEIVTELADPLARRTFGRHLGLPTDALDRLAARAGEDGDLDEALAVLRRSRVFADLHGSTELTGVAERVRVESADLPTFVRTMRFLYAAAVDTVAQHLALVVLALVPRPDLRALLRAEPSQVRPAIDELLRHDSGIAVVRQARHVTQLGDVAIGAGDLVLVLVNVANRDEAVFEEADDVVLGRPRRPAHLAFGAGPHRCPGADLGREVLVVAIQVLLARFPSLELEPDTAPSMTFSPLRRVGSLHVQVGGEAPSGAS